MYDLRIFTPPSMKPFTQSYSCRVSKETRSMHRFLNIVVVGAIRCYLQ